MSQPKSPGATLVAQRIEALQAKQGVPHAAPPAAPRARAAPATAAPGGNAGADSTTSAAAGLPAYVKFAIARWLLLNDLPFRYLVPDARLLPAESIRFFTLDSDWLDALASGALIAGGGGTREITQVQAALPGSLVAAAEQMSSVRDVLRGRLALDDLPAAGGSSGASSGVVSGFLLHSALVSGWPAMQIRAWASDDPADVPAGVDPTALAASRPELVVPILRLERLSPAVLVAMFDGVPRLVWLEEPHHGVQCGLDEAGSGFRVAVRDESGKETGTTVAVPMRAGPVSGVVDISGLAAAIDAARPCPEPRGSAGLALQLLRAPARQRFNAGAQP